jgi:hypothetical protein
VHLVPEPVEVLLVGLVVPLYVDCCREGWQQLCVHHLSVLVLTVKLLVDKGVYHWLLGHNVLFPGVAAGNAHQAHQEGKCELPLHWWVCWWWVLF